LSQRENANFWFQAKEEIVQDCISPYLGSDSRILIVGVGNGITASRLRGLYPNCSIFGVDIDPAAIETCNRRDPEGTYILSDIEHDEFEESVQCEVDIVIALDVLEHLHDDAEALRRLARRLRPGGLLVVNVPAHKWLYSRHDAALSHFRRYAPTEIKRLIQQQGFAVVHSTPLFMTCLVLLAFWRLVVLKVLPVRKNQSDVSLELPRFIDRILYRLAMMEARIARHRLPFGSSHLVIARRNGLTA
jgi:SAM-dependent methyltransferase